MKAKAVFLCILFFFGKTMRAQLGGNMSFAFAFNPPSPRSMALGGTVVSQKNRDLSTTYQNPALLDPNLHKNELQISYSKFIEDINNAYVSYAMAVPKIGTVVGHIFVSDYANLEGFDETGSATGNFNATDYAFKISAAKTLNEKWRTGTNINFLYSAYERYVATAFGLDASLLYTQKDKNLDLAFVLRNLSYNVIPYNDTREHPSYEIMASISKKLEHNPLRITLMARNLQKWDLTYIENLNENQQINIETGELIQEEASFFEKGMRHVGVSAEMLFSKNFHLIFGYNHQRRKEMALAVRGGFTGFSWGFCINVKKYQISYAHGGYFPGQGANFFGIQKNLSDFTRQ